MSNVCIDERLLDTAGLSDFPELYAYIKERYPKPIGELPQPDPIGDQTLQQQVKNNNDIIYASNQVFNPPVPNVITKLDLSSQLERQNFLASSGSDPQLIVYGDRITLTASNATTGLFPCGDQLGASNEASTEEPESHIDELFIKPFAKPILGALGPVSQTIGKDGLVLFVGLKSGSNLIREYTIYHRGKTIDGSLQNDTTNESFIYNTINPKSSGTYICMREIEELIGNQTAVPYTIPIRFRVNIPLDDLLIFSAFTDYPNDELLSSSQQKLMDIDLMFRNWSLTFKSTKQFTQLGCTAELITGLYAEPLTESGLKNLVCDIKFVTMNIKNYVITEVMAIMADYKATDACLNRVRQFYSQRPYVVPAQRVEVWPFPTLYSLMGI
ncbi:MAG: hypothetical protein EZS28_016610 [Streblomastix strix]|uniref:Uncharacterized protein n=1 Tax=Streblomastix strix TaxID=222440 RepID=A0A5J4VZ52_9EUKA|nr:MAG: hypothetical protein EZS28_016610 [Streblomastix strix]